MELKPYFETTTGTGILSTADDNSHFGEAIYSRPRFFENKIAFILKMNRE